MKKKLESNIWKLFVYQLTSRRHYITILSIFFMTLPNSTARQIGLFNLVGNLTSFIFEIPSGYISDRIGHKKTLVLSKIFFLLSTITFLLGNVFWHFALGSLLMSLGFSFFSGTYGAFIHNTLHKLKKDKDYVKITSKISANASLVSVFLVFSLPFLTKISFKLPFIVNIVFDIIGIIFSLTLVDPKIKFYKDQLKVSVFKILKQLKGTGFFITTFFVTSISGFLLASSPYRPVYLESLGLPVIFIGSLMGGSRFIWFLFGNYIHKIEKIKFKTFLKFEMFLFPLILILSGLIKNYIFVLTIYILTVGYFWGRSYVIQNEFLNKFIINKNYKATILSIKQQFSQIITAIVLFGISFFMNKSYSLGFLIMGITLFIVLIVLFPFVNRIK